MALIIENGTVVANASSYVTLAEARAFALARSVTLSAVDSEVESKCILAMDFLEALRDCFKGSKVGSVQALQFPRYGVQIDGFDVASNTIPKLLKDAQCQLVIELASGIDLTPTDDGKFLIREKVDVIENEWAPGGSNTPTLTKFDSIIAPLLKIASGGLTTRRA